MPTQTFELKLFDTTRTGQLMALLMLGAGGLVAASIWVALRIDNKVLLVLALAAIVGGGGVAGWRAFSRAAIVPAVVRITPAELRIEDLRPEPRLSQTLRLADISTYRYQNFNNTEELRLHRAGVPPLRLRSPGALAPADGFGEMVAAFEQAMGEVVNPPGVATRREKSFFEKPVSTYLLVGFTLALVTLGGASFASGQPVRGNFVGILGTYIAYVVAWRAAAARRNAP